MDVLPDADLFFIDKVSCPCSSTLMGSSDAHGPTIPTAKSQRAQLSLMGLQERRAPAVKPAERRKAARVKGQKVLRSQAILQAAHAARPVVMPKVTSKGKPPGAAGQAIVTREGASRAAQGGSKVYDLWGDPQPAGADKQDADAEFDELAQALAAKKRTPYGAIRPAKRR